jgi:hypothetical protein
MIAVPVFGAAPHAAAATPSLPYDTHAAGGTACEAAYSSTRALSATYDGTLYQVQRASHGTHLNVGPTSAGGAVNIAPQTSFRSGTTCIIAKLYNQTSNGYPGFQWYRRTLPRGQPRADVMAALTA